MCSFLLLLENALIFVVCVVDEKFENVLGETVALRTFAIDHGEDSLIERIDVLDLLLSLHEINDIIESTNVNIGSKIGVNYIYLK